MPKTTSPSSWLRVWVPPRTPNVSRRLAAVLAIAVTSRGCQVGRLGTHRVAQENVEHQVGEGAGHPDGGEADGLPGERHGYSGDGGRTRSAPELGTELRQRKLAGSECATQPGDALQVGDGGLHDVDPAVGVIDPVDRHLVDTQAGPLAEHEQLGVEEPAVVLHQWEQLACRVSREWP